MSRWADGQMGRWARWDRIPVTWMAAALCKACPDTPDRASLCGDDTINAATAWGALRSTRSADILVEAPAHEPARPDMQA